MACGIFQELTIQKNPILLEIAKQIDNSNVLWANAGYHSGLKRCIKQYISLFDEKLLQKQKNLFTERCLKWIFILKSNIV